VLFGNRAFAHVKLQRWNEAEKDATCALEFNAQNTKARYRRAIARFELQQLSPALQDIEAVLKELTDPRSNKEAVELKAKIDAGLRASAAADDRRQPETQQ
jgi:tetratricopeptide (TPR) repeat protein